MSKFNKYVFVKPFLTNGNVIPAGSELSIVTNLYTGVYFNGGLIETQYQNFFLSLIEKEDNEGYNYLEPVGEIYNKV